MVDIAITPKGPEQFEVVLDGAHTYAVTVPPSFVGDRLKLTGVDAETVVRESFVFLLEREPPSSIMQSFSLDVISRYFPEYHDEMRRRLSPAD